ncbi:hypothetical protein [Streptomyces sp. G7(2002)]|uniref:hypothetical protein n=1 Tax=Streptomyces sp. G7(2002) TaxID=2971798 RepID=UPI00237E9FDD|nr:hypothetical protein [Streptomyces sp. G7(2002)]WDT55884.1 hypothetical protein NUT86_18420 [Streptomyces sp. G7(2002)]
MTRARAISFFLTTAGVGVLAAVVRVLLRPSAALPRWDLLACLALTVVGLVGALVCLRRGPFPQGGRAETRGHWWPDRIGGWIATGMCAGIVPVGLFFYAALSFSPEADRITEAKGRIQAIAVQKVLSSEYVRKKHSGHYKVVARLSVPFDAGTRSEKAEFTSKHWLESGDKVWALYAPSSANLGFVVDTDREALEEKLGGTGHPLMLMGVGVLTVCCSLFGLLGEFFSRTSRSLRGPLKKGLCRSLPVTVKSVGVVVDETTDSKGGTTKQPKPRLKLEGREGGHLHVLLDPVVDPSHLSREIKGLQAKLYWVRFAAVRPGPKRVRAMLVLDGQRCVQGVLRVAGESECPEGDPVPAAESLPEGDGLRAIRTYPAWDPELHSEGLWWLVAGVVALGAVAFGVGRWATFILCVAAYGFLFIARMVMKDSRTRYLKGFLPDPG